MRYIHVCTANIYTANSGSTFFSPTILDSDISHHKLWLEQSVRMHVCAAGYQLVVSHIWAVKMVITNIFLAMFITGESETLSFYNEYTNFGSEGGWGLDTHTSTCS